MKKSVLFFGLLVAGLTIFMSCQDVSGASPIEEEDIPEEVFSQEAEPQPEKKEVIIVEDHTSEVTPPKEETENTPRISKEFSSLDYSLINVSHRYFFNYSYPVDVSVLKTSYDSIEILVKTNNRICACEDVYTIKNNNSFSSEWPLYKYHEYMIGDDKYQGIELPYIIYSSDLKEILVFIREVYSDDGVSPLYPIKILL